MKTIIIYRAPDNGRGGFYPGFPALSGAIILCFHVKHTYVFDSCFHV